jgi:histidinol-phosphatase
MTGPPVATELLDYAVDVARRAGELTLRWFATSDVAIETKADGTPVTDADRAAEDWIRGQLARDHPDDGVIGEEAGTTTTRSGRRWIIDPIDGTKAFVRGVPLYATLLAYEDDHGPSIGVIVLPALGQAVWAGRQRGCWFNGQPAQVSKTPRIEGAYLVTSSFSHWDEAALLNVKRADMTLQTWGDGYGYALVATGRADAMVDPEVSLYDVAPMPVILGEAGGRFTSLSGEPSADAGSGVATNGRIHDEVLSLLT